VTTATAEPVSATLKTEKKALADLRPADYNPNDMTDAQLRSLAASMDEFGYVEPVVWNRRTGNIVGGHQRVRVLSAQGVEHVDVVVVDLDDAEERTLNIALNTIRGQQETTALADVLATLSDAQRSLAGWDEDAFTNLLSKAREHLEQGKRDPNAVPDSARKRAKAGDVFALGEHRLLCGDSMHGDLFGFMEGKQADCVFTSPPYGLGIDYGKGYDDTFENVCALIAEMPDALTPHVTAGGFIVVNFGDIMSAAKRGKKGSSEYPMALVYFPAFNQEGIDLWSRRIWCKPTQRCSLGHVNANRAVADFEHVWTWKKQGRVIRKQTTGEFWSAHGWIDTSKMQGVDVGKEVHGAGMAVGLAQFMLAVHSRKRHIVLEPFAGTGTTLIVAEQMQRVCYAVEQEPTFCDIILRRWEEFTGEKARKA
jgi:hypothetical protein